MMKNCKNRSNPPLSKRPHGSASSNSNSAGHQSSSSRQKSSRKSTSDSPSASACNSNGRSALEKRLRSVLCHPLGLPLVQALHGGDPSKLSHLKQGLSGTSDDSENTNTPSGTDSTNLGSLFKVAVEEWVRTSTHTQKTEDKFTKILSKTIEASFERTGFHSHAEVQLNYFSPSSKSQRKGRTDILLSELPTAATEKATPLALIEVGRSNSDWWMKLDQNSKYLDAMLKQEQTNPLLLFVEPLLFAVLTMEGEGNNDSSLRAKLGVFLCVPKNNREDYRMALLWRVSPCSLQEASNAFGHFLRVTSSFAEWRKNKKEVDYQYLSSNCCRVGNDQVLRSYDSRVRPTNRSPEIYRDTGCQDIVGGEVTVVLEVPAENEETDVETANNCSSNEEDPFWVDSSERRLLIIGIPYKKGSHTAGKPTDFIPIIEQLQQLHDAGYVHGDIRAFNTVFEGSHGGLIDFDFGGKAEKKAYPKGYRKHLADGWRIGSGESHIGSGKDENPDNKLAFWHDRYALGRLIFSIHELVPPDDADDDATKSLVFDFFNTARQWQSKQVPLFTDAIEDLTELLKKLEKQDWRVLPSADFQEELANLSPSWKAGDTKICATGSPPKVK